VNGIIESNKITHCTNGIYGGGTIRNNTISNNTIGITVTIASTNITHNNLYINTQNNIRTSSQINVDATNNWWGTADVLAINQTIYDSKNASGLGNITFTPFLTSPNPNTPALESITYVPNPTPNCYSISPSCDNTDLCTLSNKQHLDTPSNSPTNSNRLTYTNSHANASANTEPYPKNYAWIPIVVGQHVLC
jgi:hypothetical protein